MSGAISLSEAAPIRGPSPAAAVHGVGGVSFVGVDGKTRLNRLTQRDPIRVLFPNAARGDIPTAVFVTTSGGLVGGDVLELSADAGECAAVAVMAQAAEKIYRSTGTDCRIDVTLKAAANAWLEWLPQETIAFEGARLIRRTRAEVAPGGQLLAGEFLVLGRRAMGERMTKGLIRDDWEIRRDGRLIWADALRLDGNIAELTDHPATLDGATAVATIVFVGDRAGDHLATARSILAGGGDNVRTGATVVNGVLLVRILAVEPHDARRAFGAFWTAFRHAVAGLQAVMPRLWTI